MVKLHFETDLATSLQAANDLNKAVEKVGKTLGSAAGEAKKLEQAARRIVDQNLSQQERYNQKLEVMAKAVKAGSLSMEDAQRTAAKMRQKLDEAGDSSRKMFGENALSSLKSYVLGMASVGTAVSVVRNEIELMRAEAERVTQAQLGAGASRAYLKRNIAVLGHDQAVKYEARAERLAAELSLPQTYVDTALAQAFSASGGDVEDSFAQARVAGRFLKTAPGEIGAFAGSLGDIAKATGDRDALRNLGFLLKVGAFSRVADAQQQAKNIPAALGSAKTFGATAEQGGALFAALSIAASDYEGDVTKTATITANESLRNFFDAKVKGKKFKAEAVDTFDERLAVLRANPKLAREFVGMAEFGRAQTRGPLEEFFTDPNSLIARKYTEFVGSFGTPGQQRTLAESTLGYLDEGRLAATGATERAINAKVEQFQLSQEADLSTESESKIIERAKQLRGRIDYYTSGGALLRSGISMSPEEAIGELELAIQRGQQNPFGKPSQELIDNTRLMIEELKGIREQYRRQEAPKPSGRQE